MLFVLQIVLGLVFIGLGVGLYRDVFMAPTRDDVDWFEVAVMALLVIAAVVLLWSAYVQWGVR